MPETTNGRRRGRRRGTPLTSTEERRRLAERETREPRHVAARDEAARAEREHRAPMDPPAAAAAEPGGHRFRPELQGLRAVAILMVVCYHIWFSRVSGGVDIFLLISAFLLTGTFVRRLEAGRPLAVVSFWLRAFTRLLPPAALVIAGTLGLVLAVFPPSRFPEAVEDGLASLTYWENWLLASRQVDYYAADHSGASPFQHFWSLSIQGQVFLLWPLLFALAAGIVRLTRARPRTVLLAMFGTLTAASLTWSVLRTGAQQDVAYFETTTRLWEFSLGSLLALVVPAIEARRETGDRGGRPERPHRVRALASWTALAAILACGWVVDVQGAFPGWIALWPLLAAGLVIMAGRTGTRWGADRILASRPLRWAGDISYALYLVHWPLLITALVVLRTDHLGLVQGALVVAVSIAIGWLLTVAVDTPVRRWPWAHARRWRTALVVVCTLVLGLAPVAGMRAYIENRPVPTAGEGRYPGATVLLPGAETDPVPDRRVPFVPVPEQLEQQWFWFSYRCDLPVDVLVGCDQLLEDDADATDLMLLYGNSHAQQQGALFQEIALEHGWQIQRPTLGGCDYIAAEGDGVGCHAWNARMRELIVAEMPRTVVLTSTRVPDDGSGEEIVTPGYPELAQWLLDMGIDVIAVRDNPRFPVDIPQCVFEHGQDSPSCSLPRSRLYQPANPAPALASRGGGTLYTLDLTEEYCPGGTCGPVIGNVLVYRDDNHVTRDYGLTLEPFVRRQLGDQGFPL